MTPRRITIGRWMSLIAIVAVNAAFVRAFVVREMFCGGILIFIAVQVGLWCLLHGRGRLRLFWMGFEVCGTTAVLLLFSCEWFPNSPLIRLVTSYTGIAVDLAFAHLYAPVTNHLDDHLEQLLAVIDFMPEFAAALLGRMIPAWLVPKGHLPANPASA